MPQNDVAKSKQLDYIESIAKTLWFDEQHDRIIIVKQDSLTMPLIPSAPGSLRAWAFASLAESPFQYRAERILADERIDGGWLGYGSLSRTLIFKPDQEKEQ